MVTHIERRRYVKLAIFGATGRTGRPLVEQALAAGHDITVLVRDPAKITLSHPRLKIVQGDATNAAKVEEAVAGADAVISTLGQTTGSPKDVQTVATKHIVAAMQQHGVRRLVSLTGGGVAHAKDEPKLVDKAFKFLLKRLQPDVLADAENHARVIRNSDLDWVVVRGPRLTEKPGTGKYRVGYAGQVGIQIPRADLAAFMLSQLTDNTYLRDLPMVSS
jgi:putative NADH-flavin reductase